MRPHPSLCGRRIRVPIPAKRPPAWLVVWVAVVVIVVVAVAMVVLRGAPLLLLWGLSSVRRPRVPKPLMRWVALGSHSIVIDGVTVQLNGVRASSLESGVLVLRLKRQMRVRVDLRTVAEPVRRACARHVEARRLLARRPRRPRGEEIALEAFFVYDAHAVRIRGSTVVEVLPPSGPWPRVEDREAIYVRELPKRAIAYRDAADTVIAIGMLA